jgi:predicted transposase YbfD/YdcC
MDYFFFCIKISVFIIKGVAQSVRSKDEQAKKHLTSAYTQIIEVLLNVSVKKTDVASELRQELTIENFDKIIEKFTSIDQSCRSILTDCLKPSSRNALPEIAQNLQETLKQIRLSSSQLSITSQSKSE